ncbi:MAG TPA: aldolase/citrate lyase family protein [Rickettsiales bacterium]|nr:aldolase/citrate lyase family protein [Rickettsiales bacterium]
MNRLEQAMLDILKRGRDEYGYVGIKAEFEAEGTRMDEMLRLIDITRRAGLKIGIKIGGGEAVRDLIDSKQIGADYIIAPMIESAYALSKYIQIKNKLYTPYEREQVRFLFNVETHAAFVSLDSILEMATKPDGADGVVFGRVDYSGSCGLSRDAITGDKVTNDCVTAAKATKPHKLDFVVGGGVALESIDTLRKINAAYLTRFETRKVIFDAQSLNREGQAEQGLREAVEFELLWLQNKRSYYLTISEEDVKRIEMLDARVQQLRAQSSTRKLVATA